MPIQKPPQGSARPSFERLPGLSASSVVAQIDAQDIQVSVGKQNLTVQIYVPAASGVFAVGSYTVECNITSR